jgi:hypothetical protein
MSPEKIMKIIQDAAWKDFPAQELWFRENDLHFWAYEKGHNNVLLTEGKYTDTGLIFTITENYTQDVENFVNNEINIKTEEGYICFASQFFV